MRIAALAQIVLLGLCAAIGLLGTFAVASDWIRGLDTWFWEETVCTIESSEAVRRPQYGDTELQVSYRYDHRAQPYLGNAYRHGYAGSETVSEAQVLAGRYRAGDKVTCWVDPEEPGRSYLRRSNLWEGFWILVPLVFLAVGAGALWLLHGPPSRTDGEETAGDGPLPKKARSGLAVAAIIFFPGIFFLVGAGFLIPFFIWPALQVVEARSWLEVPCEILSSGVRSHPGDDSTTYSVDALYRYEIDGRSYQSNRYGFMGGSSSGYERKARIVAGLEEGTTTLCYVDPNDPFNAVIERGFTADYLFGVIPLLFTLIGAGGLVFVIKGLRDARRDAARPSWAAPTEPGDAPALGRFAAGPTPEQPVTDSLVLEPTTGPLGKLGCTILGALFWNGFLSIFVWQVVESWKAGTKEWFVILVLTPFVLIGLLLLAGIPYSILALLNPRARVSLTPGTLRVGESAQLKWSFTGFASRVRHLEVWLEATETQTHHKESGVRIETRPLDTPKVSILDRGRDQPLESGGVTFTIPTGTPLSSDGDPSIAWKLKLHGEIAYWPDVAEEYEVRLSGL